MASSSIFRLAVYAIAALALLWIIFTYLLPLFFPPQDVVGGMGDALAASQTSLGKTLTKEILYPENFAADAEQQLDEPDMGVVFKCNSASLCLDGIADVDEKNRRLYVRESRDIMTSFRCIEERGMHACVIYLGSAPAQVEILDFEAAEKYNLSRGGKPKIAFTIANTGALAAVEVTGTAKVYRKTMIGGEEVEQLFLEPPAETISAIEPEKTARMEFDFSAGITKNGKYAVDVKVEGPDAGFGTKRFEFEVSGAPELPSTCVATEEGETTAGDGICETKYFCEGCAMASECKWAWEENLKGAAFEIGSPKFTIESWGASGENCGTIPAAECTALSAGYPATEAGKCVTRYYCAGCATAEECKAKWDAKLGIALEAGDVDYAKKVAELSSCGSGSTAPAPQAFTGSIPDTIRKYAKDYGVPPDLAVAVGMQESTLNQNPPGAGAGAIGVMQVIPPPKKAAGLDCLNAGIITSADDLKGAEGNIRCGVWYLKEKYNQAMRKGEICCKEITVVIVNGKEQKKCNIKVNVKPCYTGWRAALRLYNGLCCEAQFGDPKYVERVLHWCPSMEACGVA